MKVLAPVKRVVDANVKVRVKADGSGVDIANASLRLHPLRARCVAAGGARGFERPERQGRASRACAREGCFDGYLLTQSSVAGALTLAPQHDLGPAAKWNPMGLVPGTMTWRKVVAPMSKP